MISAGQPPSLILFFAGDGKSRLLDHHLGISENAVYCGLPWNWDFNIFQEGTWYEMMVNQWIFGCLIRQSHFWDTNFGTKQVYASPDLANVETPQAMIWRMKGSQLPWKPLGIFLQLVIHWKSGGFLCFEVVIFSTVSFFETTGSSASWQGCFLGDFGDGLRISLLKKNCPSRIYQLEEQNTEYRADLYDCMIHLFTS